MSRISGGPFRAPDPQSTMATWIGTTKRDPQRVVGLMVEREYVPGEKVLPPRVETRKLRPPS